MVWVKKFNVMGMIQLSFKLFQFHLIESVFLNTKKKDLEKIFTINQISNIRRNLFDLFCIRRLNA